MRDLLAGLLPVLRERTDELWIPADVYPVYDELARRAELEPRRFATMPSPEWEFIERAGPRAVVLLPVPLAPIGRWLEPAERDRLLNWLCESEERRLVVDAAYTFDFANGRSVLEAFLSTGRCAILFSAAKSWLRHGSYGVAWIPEDLAVPTRDRIAEPGSFGDLPTWMTEKPNLPLRLEHTFRRTWARLEPRMRDASSSWRAPDTGYFGIVRRRFEELLSDHGILSVPASVFGSTREDVSVVSCLYVVPSPVEAERIA